MIQSCVEIVGGLNRPNIFFEVREKKKKDDEVFKQICDFILTKYPNRYIFLQKKKNQPPTPSLLLPSAQESFIAFPKPIHKP